LEGKKAPDVKQVEKIPEEEQVESKKVERKDQADHPMSLL
jgi:hypothetical protein